MTDTAIRPPAPAAPNAPPASSAARATPPMALYLHMPWCVKKCPYCDFNSHQLSDRTPDGAYIDALIDDCDRELPLFAGRRIETVFFGGGTPSLFSPEDIDRLLTALRRRLAFDPDAEVTLEANPGTIERGRFAGYRAAGINRVSLGAQSFSATALARLGRIHSPDDTRCAVEELHAAGIDNFNLDLMFALPQQSHAEALFDIESACALAPRHISHYQLTLEPGTVFHARPPVLPDEDAAWDIQVECQARLRDAGYEQYEVSAYARDGAHCRHNVNYWNFGDYLGLGAGAHGKLTEAAPADILRTAKPKQPRDFQRQLAEVTGAIGERRRVAGADLPFEFMLGALRLNAGFAIEDFEARTGLAREAIEAPLVAARRRGLIANDGSIWRPTELGRRFLNDLQGSFLA
jgi:oxygen-independent coproporphyrinogen-3 oxidase